MQSPSDSRSTPESRSTEFVAVEGGGETTSASALMVVAYAAMWALVFGFLLLSMRRQRRIEQRLAELDRALAARAPR
ncbi:MAG: CcmD family protein [Myxococcota bacterium]